MYAFLDQPIGHLDDGSRFLLWAMRSWPQLIAQRRCPPAALAPAFAGMAVLPALPDFHMTMMLFNRDGIVQMTFSALEAACVVDDEAAVLGLWRAIVVDDIGQVRATLPLLVKPEAIDPVVNAMVQVAAKLAYVGLAPKGLRTDVGHPESGRAR